MTVATRLHTDPATLLMPPIFLTTDSGWWASSPFAASVRRNHPDGLVALPQRPLASEALDLEAQNGDSVQFNHIPKLAPTVAELTNGVRPSFRALVTKNSLSENRTEGAGGGRAGEEGEEEMCVWRKGKERHGGVGATLAEEN